MANSPEYENLVDLERLARFKENLDELLEHLEPGGPEANSFGVVSMNGVSLLADIPGDTLTLVAGQHMSLGVENESVVMGVDEITAAQAAALFT